LFAIASSVFPRVEKDVVRASDVNGCAGTAAGVVDRCPQTAEDYDVISDVTSDFITTATSLNRRG